MRKIIKWKIGWIILVYIILDVLAVGLGMGVAFFNIFLGLPAGVYIGWRIGYQKFPLKQTIKKILLWAALSAGVTLILMLVIWAPTAFMLFDPAADLANFGIPMILYEPRASFIGWQVLMILIAPFLQFLMTNFGAQSALIGVPETG